MVLSRLKKQNGTKTEAVNIAVFESFPVEDDQPNQVFRNRLIK